MVQFKNDNILPDLLVFLSIFFFGRVFSSIDSNNKRKSFITKKNKQFDQQKQRQKHNFRFFKQ